MIKSRNVFLTLPFAASLLGCAIPQAPDFGALTEEFVQAKRGLEESIRALDKPVYEGIDTVGAVDPSRLHGTWMVQLLNKAPAQPDLNIEFTMNPDKSFQAYAKFDLGATLGKLEYDMKGDWLVDGDFVGMTETSTIETTGNPLVQPDSEEGEEPPGLPDLMNVYELTDTYMVMYHEPDDVAYSFTRVQ